MFRAVSNSYTGIKSYQNSLDQTSNNIANVNTNGHKKGHASFNDLLYREINDRRMSVSQDLEAQAPQGGKGSRVSSVTTSFEQGDMKETGRTLDLAIDGEGFFRVIRDDDTVAYTRDGTFFVDSNGDLVNARGDYLDVPFGLSEYTMGDDEDRSVNNLMVGPDGSVHWKGGDEEEPEELGQIELHRFMNPEGLESGGGNNYLETELSGGVLEGNPGEDGFGQIRQGFIEGSNVDLAEEMTNMIKDQSALQSSTRAMRTSDELWTMTLQAKV